LSEHRVFEVESLYFFWIFSFVIFTFLFNILFNKHSQSCFFWLFCVAADRLEVFMLRIWYLNIDSKLSFLKSLLKSHCKFSRFVLCYSVFIQLHWFFFSSSIHTEFSCCMNEFKDIIDFSFSSDFQTMWNLSFRCILSSLIKCNNCEHILQWWSHSLQNWYTFQSLSWFNVQFHVLC